jgi:hypothetical protein
MQWCGRDRGARSGVRLRSPAQPNPPVSCPCSQKRPITARLTAKPAATKRGVDVGLRATDIRDHSATTAANSSSGVGRSQLIWAQYQTVERDATTYWRPRRRWRGATSPIGDTLRPLAAAGFSRGTLGCPRLAALCAIMLMISNGDRVSRRSPTASYCATAQNVHRPPASPLHTVPVIGTDT